MALSFTQHLMSKDDLKKKSTGNKLTKWDELSEYFRKQLEDDDKRPLLSIEDRTDEKLWRNKQLKTLVNEFNTITGESLQISKVGENQKHMHLMVIR